MLAVDEAVAREAAAVVANGGDRVGEERQLTPGGINRYADESSLDISSSSSSISDGMMINRRGPPPVLPRNPQLGTPVVLVKEYSLKFYLIW